jgi:hypothetical protein
MMLAAILKAPGWAITDAESVKLSDAINTVTALYDVPILDERSRAWLGLAMVGAEVYGTRIATEWIKQQQRAREARAGGVTPIRQPQPQPGPAPVNNPFEFITPPGTPAHA